MTPWLMSTTVNTTASGTSTRVRVRVMSTQKLPMVDEARRARPRMRATATAIPTAAETKFCTASPAICTR